MTELNWSVTIPVTIKAVTIRGVSFVSAGDVPVKNHGFLIGTLSIVSDDDPALFDGAVWGVDGTQFTILGQGMTAMVYVGMSDLPAGTYMLSGKVSIV